MEGKEYMIKISSRCATLENMDHNVYISRT